MQKDVTLLIGQFYFDQSLFLTKDVVNFRTYFMEVVKKIVQI